MSDYSEQREADVDKGGRPRIEINFKTLDKLCALRCTAEECAAMLDMSADTLDRRLKEEGYGGFAEYFKQKGSGGKVSLRRKQMEVAMSGNVSMLIWLGKQHLGQSEKVEQEIKTEVYSQENIDKLESFLKEHGIDPTNL